MADGRREKLERHEARGTGKGTIKNKKRQRVFQQFFVTKGGAGGTMANSSTPVSVIGF